MSRVTFRALWRTLLPAALALVLAGCGGSKGCQPNFGGPCPDTGGGVEPVANLILTLSAPTVNNTGAETVTATVTAVNSNNATLEGAPVVLSVDNGGTIAVDGSATGADGKLTGEVGIGENRANRTITVRAVANDGGLAVSKTIQVVGANLSGTAVPAVLTPSAPGQVQFRLVDANSLPMAGVTIVVTGPSGAETSGVTDSNGDYDYDYTSPAAAGEATIRASAGGDETSVAVVVQPSGSGTIPPVDVNATPVRSESVAANPSVVAVNNAATNNQSQIRALFLTTGNRPIKNLRVRFDLDGDVNAIGGTFTAGSNIVYTDDNGIAVTSYVPGTRSSPTDGVTIRACWNYVDFNSCSGAAGSVRTTLTVIAEPVSISIGTNNLIEEGRGNLTYIKRYAVQVVDSSGLAKPGVQITPSVDLLRYIKGHYEIVGDVWAKVAPITFCDNEDLNRNNTSETYSDGWVEDVNGSFNLTNGRPALEPRKADVSISFDGSNITDASGLVVIKLEYPQDLGSWVEFNILVTAGGIAATEGRANYRGILPVLSDHITDVESEPPFINSPYGVQTGDPTAYTFTDGVTYSLCTNPN